MSQTHLSILHWPDWYKRTLAFTIEQQFMSFNNRAKKNDAYRLLKSMCEPKQRRQKRRVYSKLKNNLSYVTQKTQKMQIICRNVKI